VTKKLNPAAPTATIIFKGLMLMCIKDFAGKKERLEVGFVQCPGHNPQMEITVKKLGRAILSFSRPINSDLYIFAVKPTISGISLTPPSCKTDFFAHHPDLENNGHFHDKVKVNPRKLSSGLSVNAGALYTAQTFDKQIDVVTWTELTAAGKDPKRFGKLADATGLDIQCKKPDGGIAIFDSLMSPKTWLPALDGTTYEISIDADCRIAAPTTEVASDFRYYYTTRSIETDDGKKFDFQLAGIRKKSPHICERAFLSKTDTFGLPALTFEELLAEEASRKKPLKK
jgi:hypothetical protein